MAPLVSVVIPSRDRRALVGNAVASALAQSERSLEVIVVDDGSEPPLPRPRDRRARLIRRNRSGGAAAARNAGLAAAKGRWVTFIDDDDRLLPDMVERALAAIAGSRLPPPVSCVSGIDVVGPEGRLIERRVPAPHPRGEHFQLEALPAGASHLTKQSLVVEAEVLRSVGGFDESLSPRAWSDLFLRLNPVCSIEAVPVTGYLLTRGGRSRISRDAEAMQRDFERITAKHRDLLAAHPRGHAALMLGQARVALVLGPRRAFPSCLARAIRLAPGATLRVLADPRRTVAAVAQPDRTG